MGRLMLGFGEGWRRCGLEGRKVMELERCVRQLVKQLGVGQQAHTSLHAVPEFLFRTARYQLASPNCSLHAYQSIHVSFS